MGTNKRSVEGELAETTLNYRSQLFGWGTLLIRHSLAKLLFSEKSSNNLFWKGGLGDIEESVTYQ